MTPIRILLVDDHPVVRDGLRSLLANHPDIEIAGEASQVAEADRLAQTLRPDVVLLDIRLGGYNGLVLLSEWRLDLPELKVIILTAYDDDDYLARALAAGAHAYLLKTTSQQGLVDAIRAVHAGRRRVSPELMERVLEHYQEIAIASAQLQSGLSLQKVETLRQLAHGATTQQIAERLFVSEATVKRWIQDIEEKLGAANRAQAVAEAIQRGLIQH